MAAYYTFEDLSGSTDHPKTDNPYHDLIESCNNDQADIQKRYDNHRTKRNAQQKEKLLAEDFAGVSEAAFQHLTKIGPTAPTFSGTIAMKPLTLSETLTDPWICYL